MNDAPAAHLDAPRFATAMVSGIHRVIGDQEQLNRINVFPVADGDTGTNLSLSLGAALPRLQVAGEDNLGNLLAGVADSLLDGARGNSGAIVAQFFQGLSDAVGDAAKLNAIAYSEAIALGNEYAHDALTNPQEGTILTVIAAYADALARAVAGGAREFPALLEAAMPALEEALAATTGQLDALRKAGVVDAGAQGFVDLVAGMHAFIVHGTETAAPDLALLESMDAVAPTLGGDAEYAYRYCTECVVTGIEIDRRKLREALAELGDSLVLAGTKRKAKVHLHVNEPTAVFDTCRRFGTVGGEKADDLRRQQHSSHDTTRHFAVITDSAADIADEDLDRLDIHMVPCRIQFGDRGYLDKVSITVNEFYSELATNPQHPTTSQPAPGDFRRQFQFLASHFPDVLSINLTGAASGTLEAARSAATRINAPGRVHVINSRNASLGQGLLAVQAAECAAAGLDIATTIERVEALIPLTRSYGVLRTLDYAVRGGRLPAWVRTVARLLRLTPIIQTTAEGRIALSTFFIGRRDRVRRLARHVARRARTDGHRNFAIGHAACPEDAERLAALIREYYPDIARLTTTDLGTALGVHGGPGALVVATQPYSPPPAASSG